MFQFTCILRSPGTNTSGCPFFGRSLSCGSSGIVSKCLVMNRLENSLRVVFVINIIKVLTPSFVPVSCPLTVGSSAAGVSELIHQFPSGNASKAHSHLTLPFAKLPHGQASSILSLPE